MSELLRLAICLYPDVTALDYQGPIELLGMLSPNNLKRWATLLPSTSAYSIETTYLSHTLEPVKPINGPAILPMRRYDEVKSDEQFDIIFIPGTPGPQNVPASLPEFVKRQAPRVKYILSVCTGSWILAGTGLLDGRRATTNKWMFKEAKAATSEKIVWVAKARWVVDGNIWTSSGVTAGMDMAFAFLKHLVGDGLAKAISDSAEFSGREQDNDEFAAVHGLL